MTQDKIIQKILDDIKSLNQRQQRLTSLSQNANIALGVQTFDVDDMPTISNTGGTQIAFAANGRNPGEGIGLGTGVLCWNNGDGGGWRTVFDGSAVQD